MVLRLWYAPRRKFFDTLADDRLVKYTPLPQRGSTNGGARRSGAATGKKLFYIALDGRLMAVPIRIASNAQTIEAGSPVPLFATRVGGVFCPIPTNQQYDVSPDGQRFLMTRSSTKSHRRSRSS